MKNGLHIDDWGNKHYYLNDKLHREDGPAIEWFSGTKDWYIDGKLHRVDGPAVEYYHDGDKWYFLDGIKYDYNGWLNKLKSDYPEDYINYKVLSI